MTVVATTNRAAVSSCLNFSGHGIVSMSSTSIANGLFLIAVSTVTCGCYSLSCILAVIICVTASMLATENMSETMRMLSLYNSVLNFLLMCMSFTTELLMFAFMFAAYLALTLSSVTSVNVMCMGTGAMVITTVLTCLALTIATSLMALPMPSPYHVLHSTSLTHQLWILSRC
jgi:hypothetical protein